MRGKDLWMSQALLKLGLSSNKAMFEVDILIINCFNPFVDLRLILN